MSGGLGLAILTTVASMLVLTLVAASDDGAQVPSAAIRSVGVQVESVREVSNPDRLIVAYAGDSCSELELISVSAHPSELLVSLRPVPLPTVNDDPGGILVVCASVRQLYEEVIELPEPRGERRVRLEVNRDGK